MPQSKIVFKPGEIIVCIDISNKSFRGYKKKPIKTVTKFHKYTVVEKSNPYNDSVFLINDLGEKKSYSTRRFVSINKFRGPKLERLKKKIRDKNIKFFTE